MRGGNFLISARCVFRLLPVERNFYGQNVFIASSGVLLILGTLKESGITGVEAYDIAKASIPMAIIAIVLAGIRNYIFDKKVRMKKGDING